MKIVVTGGAGFLGRKLIERVIADRPDITSIVVVDQADPPPDDATFGHPAISTVVGDVADPGFLATAIPSDADVVYHLASVVSAGAEADFDLGYRVNLIGTLNLLERCRALDQPPVVVFASSVATYGPGADPGVGEGVGVDDGVNDQSAQRPQSSYGVQKTCCELLINDYTRKGFIDGRVLRLPTVTVRPGKPNKAASGFASGIIREPLAGIDAVCPVAPETVIAVISPRRVTDALLHVIDLDSTRIGADRTIMLPGLSMTAAEAVEAVRAVATENGGDDGGTEGRFVGRIDFEPDAEIQSIIDSWPPSMTSKRAENLGFGGDSSVAAIVRQHITDEIDR